MTRLLLVVPFILLFSCSKKSSDDPAPVANNNNTNQSNNTSTLTDSLTVTFKGKSYTRTSEPALVHASVGNYGVTGSTFKATNPEFTIGLALPEDSSKLVKLKLDTLNLRIGEGSTGTYLAYYEHYSGYFYGGDTARYFSGQIVKNDIRGERKADANNYVKLKSLVYKGVYTVKNPFNNSTYDASVWVAKGDFSFVIYNENHLNDSTKVSGKFSMHLRANPF